MKTLALNCSSLRLVAFTGHRPSKFGGYDESAPWIIEIKEKIREAIVNRIKEGYVGFISGMALGVDIWAAEIVLELKEKYSNIILIAAVPFEGQERMWPDHSKKRWKAVLDKADYVEYVSDPGYAPWKMRKRNECTA